MPMTKRGFVNISIVTVASWWWSSRICHQLCIVVAVAATVLTCWSEAFSAMIACFVTSCSLCFREEPVRQHLRNVYASVAMSTVSAAMGVYVNIVTQIVSAGLLTLLGSLGLLLLLLTTPDNGKNRHVRLGYLLGFAFCVGRYCYQIYMSTSSQMI